jgi:hypothetical protein
LKYLGWSSRLQQIAPDLSGEALYIPGLTCQFKPFQAGHVEKMHPTPVCFCTIENLHAANVGVLLHCTKVAGLFGPQSLFLYI